ncbi:hypothetical protein AAU57_08415 [Nonlabens sp. YIK11]|uniref:caspase family protein n=1 Tax=Nonlabens sp. YIK11 TaxID=1453349 RepID=UPI0006DCE3C4|nr:caspase family protein [Nonlabens sp. YIK11]KQC33334.1 hypothetical protein AAU57_08415 [Nonlabens sp. YIK11]
MKKLLLTLIVTLIGFHSYADKYALIVAIGDYPEGSGWGDINSVNDVELISNALQLQGFSSSNITTLINAQATKQGLDEALTNIQEKMQPGDVLVVHFSAHGQQIYDDNGDEVDRLDESIVPFDAQASYSSDYTGQNHYRDDQIGKVITNLRNKLGSDGQLLFILDSCHSGSASRGAIARGGKGALVPPNWEKKDNATADGSDMVEKVALNSDAAPFVMISGASARELNYEYQGKGSLSYAFAKAMSSLGTDYTYRQLFNKIASEMATIAPRQNPVIEGDVDYKLFNGEYVQQQPFYSLKRISNPKSIVLNAGSVQQLNEGTTISVLPADATSFDKDLVITQGKVNRSKFNESYALLDKDLPTTVAQDYAVYIEDKSYGDIAVKVFFDNSVKDKSLQKEVEKYLATNSQGSVVTDINEADLVVSKEDAFYVLQSPADLSYLNADEDTRGSKTAEDLNKNIFIYARGNYLRDLEMKNPTYEFSFKLVPENVEDESQHLDENGVFKVNTTDDVVYLNVTNNSNKDLYFTVLEIYTDGKILPFMPNAECDYTDDERLIPRRSSKLIKGCRYQFGSPYERIVLKGFASSQPINMEPVITEKTRTRSATNPLEAFVKQTENQSRGQKSSRTDSGSIKGYTTEFIYEIINE